MSGACVLAVGAVSALGIGDEAFRSGEVGQRARIAIEHDVLLERAGLARPVAARARPVRETADDRATDLLGAALGSCLAQLDPGWLKYKIGLALGTSSGGMLTAERFFAAFAAKNRISRALARGSTYFAPLSAVLADVNVEFSPRVLVLGACASSTLAIGLALRWLELGRCDIVLAGGFDALSLFVASGFEALRATTAARPRPFRLGRDGMALGEGAGVVALAREPLAASKEGRPGWRPCSGFIAGFGASTDAVHLTAPDASGSGLARAAALALADAGVESKRIDLVSAHATATAFNDPAETKALRRALGDHDPQAVHPFKAQIGHTLGAAGVLESLAALDALARGIAPAAAGEGPLDPECVLPLLDRNGTTEGRTALKLSSAFGGANASLVLTTNPVTRGPARTGRSVFLRDFAVVSAALDTSAMAPAIGGRHPHLHRLDPLSRLVLTAVHTASLRLGAGTLVGAGLIVGYTLATLEQNDYFERRRRERGARAVEPRAFPATSPNAAPGECAIAFQLTGPSFAVGGSLHGGLEALSVARDLVAARDASAMLVVAADLDGPASAALLGAAGAPRIPEGACVCLLGCEPGPTGVPLDGPVPATLGGGGDDWVWAPPCGHVELSAYLEGLWGR